MLYKDFIKRKVRNKVRINSSEGYPCIFNNSKGRPLKDYKLYGNSIQDGTPNPDNPIEIQSVGDLVTDAESEYYGKYKISIISSGINKLSNNIFPELPRTPFEQNSYRQLYPEYHLSNAKLKKNTVYTIVAKYTNINGGSCGMILILDLNSYPDHITFTKQGHICLKFNTLNYLNYLVQLGTKNNGSSGGSVKYENFMILEGDYTNKNIPTYEPYKGSETTHIYLDAPLRKVGNYADYIDFKHQKVVRNIVKRSLGVDGIYEKMENIIRFSDAANMTYGKLDYHMRSTIFRNYSADWHKDRESIFHHPGTWYAYYWSVYWHRLGLTYDGRKVYRTDDTEQTPLTDSQIVNIAKEWLNTLSDKDREIYIILDTPTEKSTTLPALKTFKGANIISVDTNISPSNIQVKYTEI